MAGHYLKPAAFHVYKQEFVIWLDVTCTETAVVSLRGPQREPQQYNNGNALNAVFPKKIVTVDL